MVKYLYVNLSSQWACVSAKISTWRLAQLDLRSPMTCHSHPSLRNPPLDDTLITSQNPLHVLLTSNSNYLPGLVNFICKIPPYFLFMSPTVV